MLNPIHHFRDEKGTGAEMHPTIVYGVIIGDALVSYWSIFSLSLVKVSKVLVQVNLTQFPSCF